MAPILANAVEKFSPDDNTIRNGFKVYGLYPWNPNAVDYTKCLAAATNKTQEIDTSRPYNTAAVSFETFSKIVGENLLQELQSFLHQKKPEDKSLEFHILHKLLLEYKTSSKFIQTEEPHPVVILNEENGPAGKREYEAILLDSNNIEIPEYINLEDVPIIMTNNSAQDNIILINDAAIDKNDISTINTNLNEVRANNENLVNAESNILIDLDFIMPIEAENSQLIAINETENNGPDNSGINTNTIVTDKSESNDNDVLDLSLSHRSNCSKKLSDFLERPSTPKRKGKKFTKRTSYAISSLKWKLNEKKKNGKQRMELKQKDAKRREMTEKKKIAKKEKEAKKLAKLQKQQEKLQKKSFLKIKKEKIAAENQENILKNIGTRSRQKKEESLQQIDNINKTNIKNKISKVKTIILSNEKCSKKIYLVKSNNE